MFKSLECDKVYSDAWRIYYDDGSYDYLGQATDIQDIIKCFEKRNLNIARNIVLVLKYDEEHYSMPIKGYIKGYLKIEAFRKYWEDIQKYLLLL